MYDRCIYTHIYSYRYAAIEQYAPTELLLDYCTCTCSTMNMLLSNCSMVSREWFVWFWGLFWYIYIYIYIQYSYNRFVYDAHSTEYRIFRFGQMSESMNRLIKSKRVQTHTTTKIIQNYAGCALSTRIRFNVEWVSDATSLYEIWKLTEHTIQYTIYWRWDAEQK